MNLRHYTDELYLRAATASCAPTIAKSYSSAVPGAGLMSACISSMLQLCATCHRAQAKGQLYVMS